MIWKLIREIFALLWKLIRTVIRERLKLVFRKVVLYVVLLGAAALLIIFALKLLMPV